MVFFFALILLLFNFQFELYHCYVCVLGIEIIKGQAMIDIKYRFGPFFSQKKGLPSLLYKFSISCSSLLKKGGCYYYMVRFCKTLMK
jgi:hypothetical protein